MRPESSRKATVRPSMSIGVSSMGRAEARPTFGGTHALRFTKFWFASSRRRFQPRMARRIFWKRVGIAADDIFAAMSQDRLDASLDIDRRTARDIVRIIQEQDALVAPAVAAEADRIAHAIDPIADRTTPGGRLL